MIFRFMDANKADFPIRFMASRLGVSTSGYYEWRHRQDNPCRRHRQGHELTGIILDISLLCRARHKRESCTSGWEGGPEKPTDRKATGRSGPTPTPSIQLAKARQVSPQSVETSTMRRCHDRDAKKV